MIGCKILSIHSFLIVIINAASIIKQETQTEPTIVTTTPYSFQYEVDDKETGDHKTHQETIEGGVVKGYYSLTEADGTLREVFYTADKHNGFQAVVKRSGTPNSDSIQTSPQIVRHGFHRDEQKKYKKHRAKNFDRQRGQIRHDSSIRRPPSPKPSTQRIRTKEPINYQENVKDVVYDEQPQYYYQPTQQETTTFWPYSPSGEAIQDDKVKTIESPTYALDHQRQPMIIAKQQFNETMPGIIEEPVEHYEISTFHGKKAHELVLNQDNNYGEQTRNTSAEQTKQTLLLGKQQQIQTQFMHKAEITTNSVNHNRPNVDKMRSENSQDFQQIDQLKALTAEELPMQQQQQQFNEDQPIYYQQSQEDFIHDLSFNQNEYPYHTRISTPQVNHQFQQIIKSHDTSTVIPGIQMDQGIQFHKVPEDKRIINRGNRVYKLNQMEQLKMRSENSENHKKRNHIQSATIAKLPKYQHQYRQRSLSDKVLLNQNDYSVQLEKPNAEQPIDPFEGTSTMIPNRTKVQVVHKDMQITNRGNRFYSQHQMGQHKIHSENGEEEDKRNKIQATTAQEKPINQHQQTSMNENTSFKQIDHSMPSVKQNADHNFQQINKFEDLSTVIPENENVQVVHFERVPKDMRNTNRGNRFYNQHQISQQTMHSENGEEYKKRYEIKATIVEKHPHEQTSSNIDMSKNNYSMKFAKPNSVHHFQEINKFEDISTVIPEVQVVNFGRVHKDMRNTNRGNRFYSQHQQGQQKLHSDNGEEQKKRNKIQDVFTQEKPINQHQQTSIDENTSIKQNDHSIQLAKPNADHFQTINKFEDLSTVNPERKNVQMVHFERVHNDMRITNRGNRFYSQSEMGQQKVHTENAEEQKKINKIQAITAEKPPIYQHQQTPLGENVPLIQNDYSMQLAKQNTENLLQPISKFEDLSTVIPEKEKVQVVHFQRVYNDMRNTNRGNRFNSRGQQKMHSDNGKEHKKRNKMKAITAEKQPIMDENTSFKQNDHSMLLVKQNAEHNDQQINKFEDLSTVIPENEKVQVVHFERVHKDMQNTNRGNGFYSQHEISKQNSNSEISEELRKRHEIQAIAAEKQSIYQHQQKSINENTSLKQTDHHSIQLAIPNAQHNFQQINKFEDIFTMIPDTENVPVVHFERINKNMRNVNRGNTYNSQHQIGHENINFTNSEEYNKGNHIPAKTTEEQQLYHQNRLNYQQNSYETAVDDKRFFKPNDHSIQLSNPNAAYRYRQINKFEDIPTVIPERKNIRKLHFRKVPQDMQSIKEGNRSYRFQNKEFQKTLSETNVDQKKIHQGKDIKSEEQPHYKTDITLSKPKGRQLSQKIIEIIPKEMVNNYEQTVKSADLSKHDTLKIEEHNQPDDTFDGNSRRQYEPNKFTDAPSQKDTATRSFQTQHRKLHYKPKTNRSDRPEKKDETPLQDDSARIVYDDVTEFPTVPQDEKSYHQQKLKRFYKMTRVSRRQKDNPDADLQNYQPTHNNRSMTRRRSNVDRESATFERREWSRQSDQRHNNKHHSFQLPN